MIYGDRIKKIMLLYPPGEEYQRAEDRCQINTEASVSNSLRACNDLGYIAAIIKNNYQIFLKDYPAEKLNFNDFLKDFNEFSPDIVLISITNGSIFEDIKFINKIKEIKPQLIIILKGALFFNPEPDLFNELDLKNADYLVGGEIEFIINELLYANYENKKLLENIQGISYKKDGNWISNKLIEFNSDLDKIPFPDRSLMNNNLYINPLVNKPMAVISTSRGCPSSCIYCISPVISGRKTRFRSAQNVFEEIKECVYKYNITDFFFKSDTFTIDKQRVIELCTMIINSDLKDKITWAANSRVNTIDEELLKCMKEAGCTIIAFGFESGSDDSLSKMKKGTTTALNKKAAALAKKSGFKIFGFYLIGFPWETKKHLEETKKLMFDINADFIELSIATPFKGSELYNMLLSNTDNKDIVLGRDSFKYITQGTNFLSKEELINFRKKTIFQYHLRISYILKKLFSRDLTAALLKNYIIYGIRLLKNLIFNCNKKRR